MASGQDCCNSCPTVQTTNIPGTPGATGAQGPQGDPGTMLPEQSFYAVGGSQAFTTSNLQLLTAQVTLPADSSYILFSGVRVDFLDATTMADITVFLKLRRSNNGPADVTNAVRELNTGIVTSATNTLCATSLPVVIYAGTAGDIIQLQGSVSELPTDEVYGSGDIIAVEAWILALPIQ